MERTGTITAVSGDTLEVTFCRPGDCENATPASAVKRSMYCW